MTPEQAKMTLDMWAQDAAYESQTTRKVIAAMPADKGDYTPDPKSMPALELAWHIASSELWFLDGIAKGAFIPGDSKKPEDIKTPADVLAAYDAAFGPALEKVKALSADDAAKPVDFFGMMQLPNAAYLGFLVKHTVHHRGQLSAYLRPMGGKVPSIYGGSADEPMGM